MNIFIIGGGTVGTITAEYFSREGHSVTVVEHDPSRIKTLQDQLDINVIEGKGTDHSLLSTAGIQDAKLFMALTDSDESNIIACTLAKFFGVPRRIARISDADFLGTENLLSLKELGVDEIVNTSEALILEFSKIVPYPGMTDIKHHLDNKYVIAKYSFSKESAYYGKPLSEIEIPFAHIPLGYEQIGGFMPYNPSVTVNEFLYAYYACETALLPELHKCLAAGCSGIRRVMIYGGGYKSRNTSGELGLALQRLGVPSIELVVENEQDAQKLSAKYPFQILMDDPSRPQFAATGNLKDIDMFLALSSNFEKNLYACSVAFRENVPYTFAAVRYPEHTSFASAIPLTDFINPAIVTANNVMRFHQADTIVSRTILQFDQVECLEILVSPKSAMAGKPVKTLPFKNSRCIALLRGNQIIHAQPDTEILPKDRVVFLLVNGEAAQLRSLL